MTRSGRARKFARKALKRTDGAARRVLLVQMILYTLIVAAVTVVYQFNIDIPFAGPYIIPIAVFLGALVNLFVNAPLTAVARQSEDSALSRMNFGRVLIAILLALLPAAIVWGLGELCGLVSDIQPLQVVNAISSGDFTALTQTQPILSWALTDTAHIILSCAAVVMGLLVIAYVCGVVGVFSRQMMLYMADSPDRLRAAGVGQALKNALGHAFVPELLVLRSLFWFLLMLLLIAGLLVGACFIASPIPVSLEGSVRDIVVQFLVAPFFLPAWTIGAALALGGVWLIGLGLVFWPRFNMMRLYYHRLMMKDTGIM